MAPQQKNETYSSLSSSEPIDGMDATPNAFVASTDVELGEDSTSTNLQLVQDAGVPGLLANQFKSYCGSFKFCELLFCTLFFVITNTAPKWMDTTPYQRPIPRHLLDGSGEYVPNLTNSEVVTHETVPFELLIFLSGVAPFLLQCLISLVGKSSGRSRLSELHSTVCTYFTAWSINMIAVEFVKEYVGYLRPFFYQLCQPNEDYTECTGVGSGTMIRKSFPSGHSATAFCGLTLLTLYLHCRFGTRSKRYYAKQISPATQETRWALELDEERMGWSRLFSILSLIPMMVALWIAASRVRDNKHFPADIIGGSLVGGAIASYTHGLWFG